MSTAEKTKAPLAGEAFRDDELGDSTGLTADASIMSDIGTPVNDTPMREDIEVPVLAREIEAARAAMVALEKQSTEDWAQAYEDAPDHPSIIDMEKQREIRAKARQRYEEKRHIRINTEQPPQELDVRATGALTEYAFEYSSDDKEKDLFLTRIVDVNHPALQADGGALLERIDLSQWHGVFRTMDVFKGKVRSKKMVQIASVPFEVSQVIMDENGGFAVEIRYMPAVAVDGEKWKTAVFRIGDIINTDRRAEAWQQLANDGLIIQRVADAQVIIQRAYTNAMKNIDLVARGSTRSGWYGSEFSADGFQTPDAPTLISKRSGSKWQQAGDREDYLKRMSAMLAQNPLIALVCGYFVAGSVIAKVGAENFILQLIGRSSAGKTLAIQTALSLRGKPKEFVTFDGTANAIKSITLANNDQGMVLDETGQWNATPEQKHSFVYDISQGKARRRLNRNMAANEVDEKAHYSVILTGEEDLLAGVKSAAAGTAVRLTTLYFDPSQGRHLWDSIRKAEDAEDWEFYLKDNHGWVMPMVIEKIREWGDEKLIATYRDFLAQMRGQVSEMTDSPQDTILRKVKLMACALTGTQILGEVLGFSAEKAFARALDVSEIINKEAVDAGVETDNYSSALRRTVDDVKNFLQPVAGQFDKVSERPWGEVKKASDGKTTLRLIQSCMESFARSYGIADKGRLLSWARDNGVLQQHVKGKNPDGSQRYTDVAAIKVGNATGVRCYVFDLSRLDEIDEEEKAASQRRERLASMSDFDDSTTTEQTATVQAEDDPDWDVPF